MSNVPMYRNTNNIAFGVSVLIVLESLFTLLYRDNCESALKKEEALEGAFAGHCETLQTNWRLETLICAVFTALSLIIV